MVKVGLSDWSSFDNFGVHIDDNGCLKSTFSTPDVNAFIVPQDPAQYVGKWTMIVRQLAPNGHSVQMSSADFYVVE